MKNREYENRWVLPTLPTHIDLPRPQLITQAYEFIDIERGNNVRVRKIVSPEGEVKFFRTIKLSKPLGFEYEDKNFPEEAYNFTSERTAYPAFGKERYKIEVGGRKWDLDRRLVHTTTLIRLETEFDSLEERNAYHLPPDLFPGAIDCRELGGIAFYSEAWVVYHNRLPDSFPFPR